MKALSLFSGIGGIDIACEWAGIETVAFCEREPFPQKVLRKHWPDVPIYDEVCTLTKERLEQDGIRTIDIIHGGYPCQPFSVAGQQEGAEDDRHLWPEVFRILQEIKPRWFVGENVAGHITLGSTRCYLIWRVLDTLGKRLLFRLLPSTHPTEETESLLSDMFPTPAASDTRGLNDFKKTIQRLKNGERAHLGQLPYYLMILIRKKGRSNPVFWEEIMGFPTGWTDIELKPLEKQSCPNKSIPS